MRMHTTGKEKTKVINVYSTIFDSGIVVSIGPPLWVVSEKFIENKRDIINASSNISIDSYFVKLTLLINFNSFSSPPSDLILL